MNAMRVLHHASQPGGLRAGRYRAQTRRALAALLDRGMIELRSVEVPFVTATASGTHFAERYFVTERGRDQLASGRPLTAVVEV